MKYFFLITAAFLLIACANDDSVTDSGTSVLEEVPISFDFSNLLDINFNSLLNYSEQYIPAYVLKDNTPAGNPITNEGATLGRILFYDKNLSVNNTVSCSSCHKQELAFSDDNTVSTGVDGSTGRHSMRLINTRFSNENRFFWDERANSLEDQTTMPIQDHVEMGFSGENGDLNFEDLITKLERTAYYPDLFNFAFGSEVISEFRIQNALSQFIRSIQSFDSKYDEGRLTANNDQQPFSNFTAQENEGKQLFLQPPNFDNQGVRVNGGVGCAGCHQAPEFSIVSNSLNNGVIGNANTSGTDLLVTKSPTLRDVVKVDGTSNGPFMHIGVSNNLTTVLNHYDAINLAGNSNIDPRLTPNGFGQQLNLTQVEKDAVIAFLRTLGGNDVYTNDKWSDPFIP